MGRYYCPKCGWESGPYKPVIFENDAYWCPECDRRETDTKLVEKGEVQIVQEDFFIK